MKKIKYILGSMLLLIILIPANRVFAENTNDVGLKIQNEMEYPICTESSHQWSALDIYYDPSCDEEGYGEYECMICGATKGVMIPELGHKYSSWKVQKKATHFKKGSKYRHCLNCYEEEYASIPKRAYTQNEKRQ